MVQDMKKMLTKAGGSEERTIFLFSDTQIKAGALVRLLSTITDKGRIWNRQWKTTGI